MEVTSYARLTTTRAAKFIISHIICRYAVPHELISDKGVHFRGEVDTLIQEYDIQHHRSSAYRPQTNGTVEASGLIREDPFRIVGLLYIFSYLYWSYPVFFSVSYRGSATY